MPNRSLLTQAMTWAEVADRKAFEAAAWEGSPTVSEATRQVSLQASRRAALQARDYFQAYAASFHRED